MPLTCKPKMDLLNDNDSIISDITEPIYTSDTLEQKKIELNEKLEASLNKFTLDVLKEKCKQLSVVNSYKMKKQELVAAIIQEYDKLWLTIETKTGLELKNLCKHFGVKGLTGLTKNAMSIKIMSACYNSLNPILPNETNEKLLQYEKELLTLKDELEKQKNPTEDIVQKQKKKAAEEEEQRRKEAEEEEQLRKATEEEDQKKRAAEEKQKKAEEKRKKKAAEEEEQRRKAAEEEEQRRKTAEEEEQRRKAAEEEEQRRKAAEDEQKKRKKQAIPKNVRTIVWNTYIGEDIIKHRCVCCKKVVISNTNFEVGHVISEKQGGTHEINNLRPICFACNHSMGVENMIDFVVKYGFYIG